MESSLLILLTVLSLHFSFAYRGFGPAPVNFPEQSSPEENVTGSVSDASNLHEGERPGNGHEHKPQSGARRKPVFGQRAPQRRRPSVQHFYKIYIYDSPILRVNHVVQSVSGGDGSANRTAGTKYHQERVVEYVNGQVLREKTFEKNESGLSSAQSRPPPPLHSADVNQHRSLGFVSDKQDSVNSYQARSRGPDDALPGDDPTALTFEGLTGKEGLPAIGVRNPAPQNVSVVSNGTEVTVHVVNVSSGSSGTDPGNALPATSNVTSETSTGGVTGQRYNSTGLDSLEEYRKQIMKLDGLAVPGRARETSNKSREAGREQGSPGEKDAEEEHRVNADPLVNWRKAYGKHSYEDILRRKMILDRKTGRGQSHGGKPHGPAQARNGRRQLTKRFGVGPYSMVGYMESKGRDSTRGGGDHRGLEQDYDYNYEDDYDFPEWEN